MGRHEGGTSRLAALTLAIGVAGAQIPVNNLGGRDLTPVLRTANSAPVVPQSAPIPLREEKRTRDLGQRVRSNVLRSLGSSRNFIPEPKNHGGKFAEDEGYHYSARDVATSRSMSRSRSTRGEIQTGEDQANEAEFAPSNDLGVLARQELGDEPDLYGINEKRLSARVKAAVDAILDPFYVKPSTRSEIDLQNQIAAIVEQSALYESDPAETAAKIEAVKAAAEAAKMPEKQEAPETKEILGTITREGKKPRPFNQQEQTVLVDYLLRAVTEGKTLEVMKDGTIKLRRYVNYDRLYNLFNIRKKEGSSETIDLDPTAIDKFVAKNLDAFRAKTHETRIQKLIQAQLSDALDGRDKTRSRERRQTREPDMIGIDTAELQALRESEREPAPKPFRKITKAKLKALKASDKISNIALAKEYKTNRAGFSAAEERAKAVAFKSSFTKGFSIKEEQARAAAFRASTGEIESFAAPAASDLPEPTATNPMPHRGQEYPLA